MTNMDAPNLIKNYNLNQGQKEAADAFFEFLFSDQKEFIISGPAGVGKTYLMNYIIDNTMPRYHEMCKLLGMDPIYTGVTMTATTNKAADVLAQATGRPTQTVHSFFRLIVKENYETGKTDLKKRTDWVIVQNLIIFIDECSMIDTELWKVIQEGTHNCKIIYVGDHNQLAPVLEKISPIYKQRSPFFELTEQMRNRGQPALMAVCQQLRETVSTGEFKPIQIVPGVIDLLDDEEMQAGIQHFFKKQTHEARILAYTNKRVVEFNDYIRDYRCLPRDYQPGELLVNNSAMKLGTQKTIPVEAEVTITRRTNQNEVISFGDTHLEIYRVDIRDELGIEYTNIMVPKDKDHYNALVKYYARLKDWPTYFQLKQEFIDLRPRDAATVHKSQGSTYDTVFIDLGNISTCHQKDQVARMLYVAFSRARNRVLLYGNLALKYGGILLP